MKHLTTTLAMLMLAACGGHAVVSHDTASSAAPSNAAPNPLVGTWRGTSICTPVRPACNDEIAVYHVAPPTKPDMVSMTMNKVVNGVETEMGGTVEYKVDYAAHTLAWETEARDGTHLVFAFSWNGNKMTGTLVELPGRAVIRNITLEKD